MENKKLTHEQRKWAVTFLIDQDIESSYKYRDRYNQFYYGILPYKDISSEELIEILADMEIEIPKTELLLRAIK